MRVLVIAEDPRLDQYMLKPLVGAALAHAGKPRARVQVCQDAGQRGDSTVISVSAIREFIDLYPMNDLYILCVDRDCREGRPQSLERLEHEINPNIGPRRLIAVCGWEELEVWVMAGLTDLQDEWTRVREHCHPKETFFEPHASRRRVFDTPGRGRKILGEEAARSYSSRIRALCPEIQVCEVGD